MLLLIIIGHVLVSQFWNYLLFWKCCQIWLNRKGDYFVDEIIFNSTALYVKKETTIGVVHMGKCCTHNICPLSSLIWHTTLYHNPTITSPSGGEEPDAVNVSHTQLYFWFWQKTANASTLGKFFTEKFQAETEATPLNCSECGFSEF